MLDKAHRLTKRDKVATNRNKIGGLRHHYGGNSCGYVNVSFRITDKDQLSKNKQTQNCFFKYKSKEIAQF